jgi:hypothetical protein
LFIFERPSMPISLARFSRSCFDQSSYFDDLPPFLPDCERLVLAIRAAFSLLAPCSRRRSYCRSSYTLDPWSLAMVPPACDPVLGIEIPVRPPLENRAP